MKGLPKRLGGTPAPINAIASTPLKVCIYSFEPSVSDLRTWHSLRSSSELVLLGQHNSLSPHQHLHPYKRLLKRLFLSPTQRNQVPHCSPRYLFPLRLHLQQKRLPHHLAHRRRGRVQHRKRWKPTTTRPYEDWTWLFSMKWRTW